MDTQHSLIQ